MRGQSYRRTFNEHWDTAVAAHGDQPFLVFHDDTGTTTYTYRDFDQIIAGTAGTLFRHGVRRGAAVHVALRNSPAFVALWLATARLGAFLVPVDPASAARDIASQIRRTQPTVGVCAQSRAETYWGGAQGMVPAILAMTETTADVAPGGPLVADSPVTVAAGDVALSDRLAVMFTSGTTSEPKGVVLSQENYSTVGETMAAAVGLRPEHRWLVALPLFHANAQYYCFAPAIVTGASVALTQTFSASRWVHQAHELSATHASLFAAPIRMILARCDIDRPPLHLEHVWFAQSLGRGHYEQFGELVGCRPRQLYGMTETVAAVTSDTSVPLRHDVIGQPIGSRVVDVVDARDGLPTPPGTQGKLRVRGIRGSDLFQCYLDDPETTNRAFTDLPDGTSWFDTGDLVVADPESGMYRFVGRADDVIKVSGENVSLTEVESVLAQAPGVLEAAVIAQPDPIRDHVPVAYVVPRDSTQPPEVDVLAQWAANNLAPAARPRSWHVIDELPRTSVGKVRRFRITAGTASAHPGCRPGGAGT
ncbi:o-succinylbenzoate--CoA ligase [Rhodococcus sp. SC4]|uniref:class I adenylate-forming enzyme family protein n=1 Tax=Rhodococcus sp. LB1 TaxID=1807499 RepID=UPI00076AD8A1|nr:AMP-binding protein [Rhodococcus sp. LB1]KXF49305.1 o-succinylbenzoate--CoA ligase [Rhodococcus sp. SC4]KXX63093.1 o-succinylbenzoate--CoA ligase [Rhodococcus sp. LB1]